MDETGVITEMRRGLLLRRMLETLREAGEPLPAGEVLRRVRESLDLTAYERELNDSGFERWDTYLRFASSWGVGLGWVTKKGGWQLTEAGSEALDTITDDQQLYTELSRRYRQQLKSKKADTAEPDPRWATVNAALELVLEGSWTAYRDPGDLVDLPAVARAARQPHRGPQRVPRPGIVGSCSVRTSPVAWGSVEMMGIYWYCDAETRRFAIGHVGRKLRDDSNRN